MCFGCGKTLLESSLHVGLAMTHNEAGAQKQWLARCWDMFVLNCPTHRAKDAQT